MPRLAATEAIPGRSPAEMTVGPLDRRRLVGLEPGADARDRAARVTDLLRACLRDPAGKAPPWRRIHRTDLGRRLQWLLALCRDAGLEELTLDQPCPACGARLELTMPLPAEAPVAPPATLECEPAPGVRLRLRPPTGEDQSRWAVEGVTDPLVMVESLVVTVDGAGEPALQPEWLPAIEAALERADPLTALALESDCPDCGAPFSLPVDLEWLLLQWLAGERQRLLWEVHRLARAYHWSEDQILTLDPTRRAFYLRCVAREERG